MSRVCSRSSSSTTASKSPCSPTTPARRRGQPQPVRPQCDLGRFKGTKRRKAHLTSPANEPLLAFLASPPDPLPTRNSARTTRIAHLQGFSRPLTDSNRRPPPYHEGGEGADSC